MCFAIRVKLGLIEFVPDKFVLLAYIETLNGAPETDFAKKSVSGAAIYLTGPKRLADYCDKTRNSTRRLRSRPRAVSLLTRGWVGP